MVEELKATVMEMWKEDARAMTVPIERDSQSTHLSFFKDNY